MNHSIVFIVFLSFCTCKTQSVPENPAAWQKIKLDFRSLDQEGLSGPSNGKVAVQYEFCIPAEAKKWKAVRRIDPSAVRYPDSKGRVGCGEQQWLVIGSTHQKNYQRILYELASLPYVEHIQQTFWE